jgi:hypothetical protein
MDKTTTIPATTIPLTPPSFKPFISTTVKPMPTPPPPVSNGGIKPFEKRVVEKPPSFTAAEKPPSFTAADIPPPVAASEIPSSQKPIKTIVITDEKIIAFFENHFMEPRKFILSAIDNYQLSLSNKQPNSTEISKTDLLKIQQEYNKFLNQKKSIISMWKENTKQLEGIEFENLDSVLCGKFGIVRESFTCSICKTKSYRNKKALSVHQRKCKKKENCGGSGANEEEEEDRSEEEE